MENLITTRKTTRRRSTLVALGDPFPGPKPRIFTVVTSTSKSFLTKSCQNEQNIINRGVARIFFFFFFWGGGIKVLFFWGGRGIKLLNSRSDVILPHKKFTWADFGGINTDISPIATPLIISIYSHIFVLVQLIVYSLSTANINCALKTLCGVIA